MDARAAVAEVRVRFSASNLARKYPLDLSFAERHTIDPDFIARTIADVGLVSDMSRYPFPHTRKLEHLCYPLRATPADAWRAFEAWRSEIVTADGARGFLRARRPDTPDGVANSTVSEGIAYGLIIAVLCDQQALFDDFYRYALWRTKAG